MKNWIFKPISARAFGFFRIVFYGLFLYLYSYTSGFSLGYENWLTPEFAGFYQPISFFQLFSYESLAFLKQVNLGTIWKVATFLAAIGFLFPVTSLLSFLCMLMTAGVSLNFGKIHHSQHMPVFVLGIMAFALRPGAFSVDGWIAQQLRLKQGQISIWALRTAQIYMTLVYFASGFQKLRNTGLDWIFSDNMNSIILTRPTVTELGIQVAQMPWLPQILALITVCAQLGAPLALFFSWARLTIIPTLFLMHVGSYLLMGDHAWFFTYNLCFIVWLPWEKLSFDSFLVQGSNLFSKTKAPGKLVQWIYLRILFPLVQFFFRLKYKEKIKLELRHSILQNGFNPFLSDIDYSIILATGSETMIDEILADAFRLHKLKIFDLPQVYLLEEWEIIKGFSQVTQDRLNFIWHLRKTNWLRNHVQTSRYEKLKKERSLKNSHLILSKNTDLISGNNFNLPVIPEVSGPRACFYSPYLGVTNGSLIIETTVPELDFFVSLLPGEDLRLDLPTEWLDFKKSLWHYEYFLTRSHLRIHCRLGEDVSSLREWLRFLEKKYLENFQQKITSAGEQKDLAFIT